MAKTVRGGGVKSSTADASRLNREIFKDSGFGGKGAALTAKKKKRKTAMSAAEKTKRLVKKKKKK